MEAKRRGQRGSIIVWAVLALGMIGAFLAVTIAGGRQYSIRGSLQNGVDSAALAGAAVLDMTPGGLALAPDAAVAFAGRHVTDAGLNVAIDGGADVVLGQWDRRTNVFTPIAGRGVDEARDINAVEVRAGREAARGNAMPVAFGGAFVTQRTLDVRARAVAVGGGPCNEDCAFPMVFADCDLTRERLDPANPSSLCGKTTAYVFHNDSTDNAGLTSLDGEIHASTTSVRNALASNCDGNDEIATQVDDQISVENGNNLNPLASFMRADRIGTVQTSPVVDTALGCTPGNPKFNRMATIVGYTSWILCWATGSQAGPWPPAGWPSAACPDTSVAEANTVYVVHLCDYHQPGGDAGVAGCGWFGTTSPRSRLVH
jgi:hypothetical protein